MLKQCQFVFLPIFLALYFSSTAQSNDLEIHHARINTTIPGMQTTAAYFELMNHSSNDIVLKSASSDVSDRVELHEHQMREGLMRMQKVETGINIKAGEAISFEPGGYHIMLMNLKKPVNKGEIINIVLHVADGETVTFEATAQKASAKKKHRHY